MSRWGKSIVVPLDSLSKEKESTNRPTVARSVGTVGKWGKMGFTSTRTYALTALPAAVAAAAAVAASPAESPASVLDDDLSTSVPEPPKPKKFFKSRNAAPPEVIAQLIQNLPRSSTSPIRDMGGLPNVLNTPVRESIKLKIPKSNSAERKKKANKKAAKSGDESIGTEGADEQAADKTPTVKKLKKKKEEKKLKPEAPPSRIIARTRKTVNYCEEDDDERMPTPIKDYILPKSDEEKTQGSISKAKKQLELDDDAEKDISLPPPAALPLSYANANTASKTPEHPPIVLRISKGTSRLVSTDSEEQPYTHSPRNQDTDSTKSPQASADEVPVPTPAVIPTITPKIIVKAPKPPTPESPDNHVLNDDEPPEINYCTVKISPDKPPKERLKLIIKTDVIRTALAKAAAAAAAKASASSEKAAAAEQGVGTADASERPEKEKSKKSKKHKHPKHAVLEQLTPTANEFKTPSPHPALALNAEQQLRTIVSPPAISERDFDSQSSVLGSISSKGNSTPLAPTQIEESCVIRSRGSSVITSDLETSQHSSLVAAPSDIESRLESMMMTMDGDASQRVANLPEEPLQEDILAVLCAGDESQLATAPVANDTHLKLNGVSDKTEEQENHVDMEEDDQQEDTKRRLTRGRGRGVLKTNYAEDAEDNIEHTKASTETTNTRSRGRKQTATPVILATDEPPPNKRVTRRINKKTEETLQTIDQTEDAAAHPAEVATAPTDMAVNANDEMEISEPVEEQHVETAVPVTRRGRLTRNAGNNNTIINNNNNNINKIAANLSAKAGAAEDAKLLNNANAPTNVAPRSYGRKRKNQQVTQVIQPSPAELEEHQPTPAKIPNIAIAPLPESQETNATITANTNQSPAHVSIELPEAANSRPNSTTPSPTPTSDYKIKDKFKRTLTIDTQAICNAVVDNKVNADTNAVTAAPTEDEQQRGAVKLVISKKKGSIFKSRALVAPDQQEPTAAKRYLYKHSWDADNNQDSAIDQSGNKANDKNASTRAAADIFSDFDTDIDGSSKQQRDSPLIGKFTRVVKPSAQPSVPNPFDMNDDGDSDTVTSVRVDRKAKDFYTVVRNVKSAHQIQEIGEYQEMDDDVEYILDALQPHNPTPTRCLSALQLATKCMTPAFRMHVRAHGIVTKFFKALSDANTDLSLGLCTSVVMFILSQEGLNMDLDRDSLELMMNLLEAESIAATPSDHAIYERNKQKVRELCEEIKAQGKAEHLNIDALSVGTLAMETLLSLTSKRAGEWFKEDLRQLGGLEHIFKTITDCCRPVIEFNSTTSNISWTQSLIENMQTVERCMRVLENVTQMNEENQKYMLDYAQGGAINTLCSLYQLCDRQIMLYPTTEFTPKDDPGVVLRTLLISVLKILINLTHSFFNPAQAYGAELLGKRTDILDTSLHLLLQTPNYIPERCVFELSMLVLLLLINLTMFTVPNRTLLIRCFAPPEFGTLYHDHHSKVTAVQAIMEYFYRCEELARLVEKNTDAILDNTEKTKKKQEEVDETVNNLLQKAGHHMEHTLKGSYAAILIGQLMLDSEEYEAVVRTHLRDNSFKELIGVLEKYYNFMNLTASSEASAVAHIKATKKLIDNFKKRELVHKMNEADDCSMPLNLETTHHSATTVDSDAADVAASSINSRSSSGSSSSSSSAAGVGNAAAAAPPLRVYKTYSQR